MKLLHLDSSVLSNNSISRAMTKQLVQQFRQTSDALDVAYRDLNLDAPAHLSSEIAAMRFLPAEQWNEAQKAEAIITELLLQEFLQADIVVMAAPMYNFTIPSQLKAWIDRVAQAGRTFEPTATGPRGLAGGKKVIIASSRGGTYSKGAPAEMMDFQEKYLLAIMQFFGITDVTFVRAEGYGRDQEARSKTLAASLVKIDEMFALSGA